MAESTLTPGAPVGHVLVGSWCRVLSSLFNFLLPYILLPYILSIYETINYFHTLNKNQNWVKKLHNKINSLQVPVFFKILFWPFYSEREPQLHCCFQNLDFQFRGRCALTFGTEFFLLWCDWIYPMSENNNLIKFPKCLWVKEDKI